MSLITQMLKDLDKRHATAGEEQPVFVDVRHSPRRRLGNYGPMALLALVVVAAGTGVWVWSQYHKPGAQPPAAQQVVAANTAPKANPVPVQPAPANESVSSPPAPPAPSPAQPVPVTEPTSAEAVSKPAEPPTVTRQTAKPEVVAVRKGSTGTPAVTSAAPEGKTRVAGKQATTKSAATKPSAVIAMTNENVAGDSEKVPSQDKPMSKPQSDQESSFKVVSPQQRSDNSYRQAILLMQQSRDTEAQDALRQAISANPANHDARHLLAVLLADAGRNADAEALLRDGLSLAPGQSGFSIALARMQIADGAREDALSTLEKGLATAGDDAEYHAFLAALLQNRGRHDEAVQHYITALRSNPSNPNWLMGVGISLKATNKMNDAAEAFQRAIDTGELTPEVAQFADQQLKEIRQQRQ
jgi:MSHA biogenesis protein MshN